MAVCGDQVNERWNNIGIALHCPLQMISCCLIPFEGKFCNSEIGHVYRWRMRIQSKCMFDMAASFPTFATFWEGQDRDLQEILGHQSLVTTLLYRTSRNDRKRASVDALDLTPRRTAEV